jgi:hypothetical protein
MRLIVDYLIDSFRNVILVSECKSDVYHLMHVVKQMIFLQL